MPCYAIRYTRKDMRDPCTAMKFAHDAQTALSLLCTGNKKSGFRLNKNGPAGVAVEILEIKEI
jgi:hypothetical protein